MFFVTRKDEAEGLAAVEVILRLKCCGTVAASRDARNGEFAETAADAAVALLLRQQIIQPSADMLVVAVS